jgi:tRNA (guanine37-N1)-methyltransferase
LIPGVLGNEESAVQESFSVSEGDMAGAASGMARAGRGILDYPHYTRPQSFRGWDVPAVLVSGNHEEIRRWRRKKALEKTQQNRPDLLEGAALSTEDVRLLKDVRSKFG